ncbi:MAG: ATP-grasp ribosomal peptide maturase [Haloechinothrix sp.]
MTILIVTAPGDPTAARVRNALDQRGAEYVQWDLGDFPQRLTLTASIGPRAPWSGGFSDGRQDLRLDDIHAVYYRRPTDFGFPDHLTGEARRFAAGEARHGFGGLLTALPALWVSHPSRIADAEFKPAQLRVAGEVGLRIPRTLITNDAAHARKFAHDVGKLVYKPLTSPFISSHEGLKLVYATVVAPDQLNDDQIALTASQFQEWVPKKHDVRLTVVGDRCFAAIIHAGSDAAYLDWRSDYRSLSYEPADTPVNIASATAAYLRRFRLAFGAFDFVVTPDDEWVLLECNPNGQWGWIEHEAGLPIGAAIADLLTGKTAS